MECTCGACRRIDDEPGFNAYRLEYRTHKGYITLRYVDGTLEGWHIKIGDYEKRYPQDYMHKFFKLTVYNQTRKEKSFLVPRNRKTG